MMAPRLTQTPCVCADSCQVAAIPRYYLSLKQPEPALAIRSFIRAFLPSSTPANFGYPGSSMVHRRSTPAIRRQPSTGRYNWPSSAIAPRGSNKTLTSGRPVDERRPIDDPPRLPRRPATGFCLFVLFALLCAVVAMVRTRLLLP